MGISLQDQLLKAGMVDKKKAQKADKARRKQRNAEKKGGAADVNESKKNVEAETAKKILRDRELNKQKQDALEQKAIASQILQLVNSNKLIWEENESDLAYNFADDSKVQKILVPKKIHLQLGSGVLSIAKMSEYYFVIPSIVARKIIERDETIIIDTVKEDAVLDKEDDPYADYQVPDDLMW